MAKQERLELQKDLDFQRKEWRVQRIGRAIWALIVLAALVGLIGPGPLSSTEASAPDGSLSVRYNRFLHYHHPTHLELIADVAEIGDASLRIFVSQPLLDGVQVLRIEPEPERRQVAENGVIYTFARHGQAQQAKVIFHMDYERFGTTTSTIGLVGREPATLTQFVYP